MDLKSTGDFDLRELATALDEQRKARGLSWSGVAREMSGAEGRRGRPLSASTLKEIGSRAVAEGDGVLQMLRWLKRPAESFMTGYRAREGAQPPEIHHDKIPRFDTLRLFISLDSQRIDRRMTWEQVTIETRWTVSGLKRLSQGGRLTNSALLIGCAELLVLSALMGQTQAVAILRSGFIVLLVLNMIPMGLLLANLHPTHAQLYTRERRWSFGILIVAAATLIPLGLTLCSGDFLIFAAVIFP